MFVVPSRFVFRVIDVFSSDKLAIEARARVRLRFRPCVLTIHGMCTPRAHTLLAIATAALSTCPPAISDDASLPQE